MPTMLRRAALAFLLLCGGGAAHAQSCSSLTAVDNSYTQNFDTLANTGTANVLALPGWQLSEAGGGARDNEQYAADTGSSNTGDTYSYGAASATERALGALRSGTLISTFGACFTNNTGGTITALDIAYVGEQWRLGTIARTDRIDFQYSLDAVSLVIGTWIDVNALDFTSPFTTTVGAVDGNAAANRTTLNTTIGTLSIANGATVWVRWTDLDATSSDDGLAVDEFSLIPRGAGGGGQPAISISDISQTEGNAGSSTFTFAVILNAPAGTGGVSFDIATADGTAQDDTPVNEDNDYVARALVAQTIPAGSSNYSFDVTVNGDTGVEPSEIFFVNLINVTGATVGDGSGQGTIVNDDVVITPIHDIQGSGASSPLVGQSVTTTGIVTGRKSNGFFVQAPDAVADADPATSEGIFVFTSSAPPVAAAVGNAVQVSGTVVEFVPSQDPLQPPITEIGSVTGVTVFSTGNALPAPIPLTATFPDPAGAHDQLERLEGMRVSAASLTVVAPTSGFTNEASATGTSNGEFHAVVTGVARPFREPGIQAPDPAPSCCGTIPPIPRWDSNPETIRVDSDALGGTAIDLSTGALVTGLAGPLDYGFRRYTIARDPDVVIGTTPGASIQAARLPTADEFTVASYNLERFFDTVNDPGSEPVLTPAAFEMRLNKASLGIRNFLNAPDILGVVEVENLTTLQVLAARINSDAVAAGQPDPDYVAYLEEGNDIGGIDVGFLIKTAEVQTSVPRVSSVQVTQLGKTTTWIDPSDNAAHLLNDRPPLRVRAVVNYADGRSFPLTAIVVHQRSLNGSTSEAPGGLTTEGNRVRRKRQAQAEFLANEIQAMQPGGAEERIVVTGDFNAFEFNDGLTDAMGVVTGLPSADAATAVPGDGVDLVTPDLVNLYTQEPVDQRYSFTFGGNAQSLDHAIANQALLLATDDFGLDHARVNADFPEVNRNDAASPSRLSDHDPLVAYFMAPPQLFADLVAAAATSTPNVGGGQTMQFSATIRNDGPDAASFPGIGFAFDAALPDLVVTAPTGWSCDAPQIVGATTSVACTAATLAVDASAAFVLSATAPADRIGSSVMMAVAVTSETNDPDSGNNQASASVNVIAVADLAVEWTMDGFQPVEGGPFHARLSNLGPDGAVNPTITLGTNLSSRDVLLTAPAGWYCYETGWRPFEAVCELQGTLAPATTVSFDLRMTSSALRRAGRLQLQAEVLSDTSDPQPGNNTDTEDTSVYRPFR